MRLSMLLNRCDKLDVCNTGETFLKRASHLSIYAFNSVIIPTVIADNPKKAKKP